MSVGFPRMVGMVGNRWGWCSCDDDMGVGFPWKVGMVGNRWGWRQAVGIVGNSKCGWWMQVAHSDGYTATMVHDWDRGSTGGHWNEGWRCAVARMRWDLGLMMTRQHHLRRFCFEPHARKKGRAAKCSGAPAVRHYN